jgi:hypothetical protein
VHTEVGWLFALDCQDPDQHDQPFGIRERLPALPMAFDWREASNLEELGTYLTIIR